MSGWMTSYGQSTITFDFYVDNVLQETCVTLSCLSHTVTHLLFIDLLRLGFDIFRYDLCTHAVPFLDIHQHFGDFELFTTSVNDLSVKRLYFGH